MSRPLVSIITPTWQRHDLLIGCIEDVRQQTYPNIEHIVVSDGPDPEIRHALWQAGHRPRDIFNDGGPTKLQLTQLGRNWSSYLPASFCAAPIVGAQLLAHGEYQMFLADDERMEPDHVASLVDALEAKGAGFAYSQALMYMPDQHPSQGFLIGKDPPEVGHITNCLYRTELLKTGFYLFGGGMTSDWQTISRWMQAGATWAYTGKLTISHRSDHFGEV